MAAKFFQLPDKTQVPEGISPGDRFQVLATLTLGPDGRSAQLIEVDGEEVQGAGEEHGPGMESKEHPMGGEEKKGWVDEVSGMMKGAR